MRLAAFLALAAPVFAEEADGVALFRTACLAGGGVEALEGTGLDVEPSEAIPPRLSPLRADGLMVLRAEGPGVTFHLAMPGEDGTDAAFVPALCAAEIADRSAGELRRAFGGHIASGAYLGSSGEADLWALPGALLLQIGCAPAGASVSLIAPEGYYDTEATGRAANLRRGLEGALANPAPPPDPTDLACREDVA